MLAETVVDVPAEGSRSGAKLRLGLAPGGEAAGPLDERAGRPAAAGHRPEPQGSPQAAEGFWLGGTRRRADARRGEREKIKGPPPKPECDAE